jgi:hypothetical protein
MDGQTWRGEVGEGHPPTCCFFKAAASSGWSQCHGRGRMMATFGCSKMTVSVLPFLCRFLAGSCDESFYPAANERGGCLSPCLSVGSLILDVPSCFFPTTKTRSSNTCERTIKMPASLAASPLPPFSASPFGHRTRRRALRLLGCLQKSPRKTLQPAWAWPLPWAPSRPQ